MFGEIIKALKHCTRFILLVAPISFFGSNHDKRQTNEAKLLLFKKNNYMIFFCQVILWYVGAVVLKGALKLNFFLRYCFEFEFIIYF